MMLSCQSARSASSWESSKVARARTVTRPFRRKISDVLGKGVW